jgi:hypothetical protein
VAKAGVDPAMVEDVFMGCGMPEGETGMNVARNATLWAGLPVLCIFSPLLGEDVGHDCQPFLQFWFYFFSLLVIFVVLLGDDLGHDCQPFLQFWATGTHSEKHSL